MNNKYQFPDKVKIFDQIYNVLYFDMHGDVDVDRRKSLCGQIDFENHNIRILKKEGYSKTDVWNSIIHEIIHAIINKLEIEELQRLEEEKEEHVINLLTVGINTVMFDNKFCFEE